MDKDFSTLIQRKPKPLVCGIHHRIQWSRNRYKQTMTTRQTDTFSAEVAGQNKTLLLLLHIHPNAFDLEQ
jgi:hypothetical protein